MKGVELPDFPVNEQSLKLLKEALNTSYVLDENGDPVLVGGEFSVNDLLNFYSGSDDSRKTLMSGDPEDEFSTTMYEMWDEHYHIHDVVRALIGKIEELEKEYGIH